MVGPKYMNKKIFQGILVNKKNPVFPIFAPRRKKPNTDTNIAWNIVKPIPTVAMFIVAAS